MTRRELEHEARKDGTHSRTKNRLRARTTGSEWDRYDSYLQHHSAMYLIDTP